MGFSMGPVDWIYLDEISRQIPSNCKITIYYHENVSQNIKDACHIYFRNYEIEFIEW